MDRESFHGKRKRCRTLRLNHQAPAANGNAKARLGHVQKHSRSQYATAQLRRDAKRKREREREKKRDRERESLFGRLLWP